MTPEDQAVLTDPVRSQHLLTAARAIGAMRHELSNIYSRLRNLNVPAGDLVDPDYVHRRAVGHTPVIDPPLGTGAPDNPILGHTCTLPRTTSALQERREGGRAMELNPKHVAS